MNDGRSLAPLRPKARGGHQRSDRQLWRIGRLQPRRRGRRLREPLHARLHPGYTELYLGEITLQSETVATGESHDTTTSHSYGRSTYTTLASSSTLETTGDTTTGERWEWNEIERGGPEGGSSVADNSKIETRDAVCSTTYTCDGRSTTPAGNSIHTTQTTPIAWSRTNGAPPTSTPVAPIYTGPTGARWDALIDELLTQAQNAYNTPAARAAAVDAALRAFGEVDADENGENGGATREELCDPANAPPPADPAPTSPPLQTMPKEEPGGYWGGYFNPANWHRWLYTGDPRCPDSHYDAALGASGESVAENAPKAQAAVQAIGNIDPTPISALVDAGLDYAQCKDAEAREKAAWAAGGAVANKLSKLKGAKKAAGAVDKVGDAGKEAKAAAHLTEDAGKVSKTNKQLRKEWEQANKKPWPKDPASGHNQDVSHMQPKADGGSDALDNIEPKPRAEHMQQHSDNGDFKRWGAWSGKKGKK